MRYHLHYKGQNLGEFSLEELRQRRLAGEFSDGAMIWRPGMAQWLPLDNVLNPGTTRAPALPPPIPKAKTNPMVKWIISACVLFALLGFGLMGVFFSQAFKKAQTIQKQLAQRQSRDDRGIETASRPIVTTEKTRTAKDVQERQREFRLRQYVEGYKERGARNTPCDPDALQMIELWIAENYGGTVDTNLPPLQTLCDRVAGNSQCSDGIALTVAAVESIELHEKVKRLERALKSFETSTHRGYPKLYATALLRDSMDEKSPRLKILNSAALDLWKECLNDGSARPEDEEEFAEIFLAGWAADFFDDNSAEICRITRSAGKQYEWLYLVLEGEHHINEAWRARGGGYANKVTEQGWKGFRDHLAQARQLFTAAWELQPDRPKAPCRMIYVSMGDSDLEEMRLWFDRTVAIQVDYAQAWSDLRWGLRPRWYGSLDAMLAFGVVAVESGRFDTDVPRKFFDVVTDLESELEVEPGERILGRHDIWPHLREMYEGYIAHGTSSGNADGWRSTYAVIAYLAGHYDVSRTQLEHLNWKLTAEYYGYGRELSFLPLEVAARTGSNAAEVTYAEDSYNRGDLAAALKTYQGIVEGTESDEKARRFVRHRIAALKLANQLSSQQWTDFLPVEGEDSAWVTVRGKSRRQADGSLEVESGPDGHMVFARVHAGPGFEIKGEFEVVRTSNGSFQAGVVMGLPEPMSYHWYSYRIKRNQTENDVASFARGWSKQQVAKNITLDNRLNTFHFRFEESLATCSVNGQEVMRQVKPPRTIRAPANEFFVGLGAFNDMNDTVIRYRNVQIRQILPASTTAGR